MTDLISTEDRQLVRADRRSLLKLFGGIPLAMALAPITVIGRKQSLIDPNQVRMSEFQQSWVGPEDLQVRLSFTIGPNGLVRWVAAPGEEFHLDEFIVTNTPERGNTYGSVNAIALGSLVRKRSL